jgi:hypothetical protein
MWTSSAFLEGQISLVFETLALDMGTDFDLGNALLDRNLTSALETHSDF